MFRRRGRETVDLPGAGDSETETGAADRAGAADLVRRRSGPWDEADEFSERERVDFGSLLVPVVAGFDLQFWAVEDQGTWITVVHEESQLQLQAFAAPKTSGLWDEVRPEIAAEVANSGGDSTEADGPFGIELRARVDPGGEGQRGELQPLRFLGVDGPRWFLRGLIAGPAARRGELAAQFEDVFADVVVVRGGHPAPPRDQLPLEPPEDARRALDEQMAAEEEQGRQLPNPFERGPEITETR